MNNGNITEANRLVRAFCYLCLHFMVTEFTVAWSRKNAHVIRFYESDRKELNLLYNVDFLSQIDFPFPGLLNINYIWNQVDILTHITEKKNKTSVTSHTDICMKAAVSPVRKLL